MSLAVLPAGCWKSASARACIGIGSGLNLPLYGDAVEEVTGIDFSLELLAMAEHAAAMVSRPRLRVRLEGSAELLPCIIADGSVDTVVVTWGAVQRPRCHGGARRGAHRVLRPGGSLRFVEHGGSPDASVAWWQDHLTPLWKRCSGGCHLNRQTDDIAAIGGVQAGPPEDPFMLRVRQNPKGSANPARYHLEGPRSGYDRVAVAPMEAFLGHNSLDRVIWIESMAEEPAAPHRSLAVRGGAGAGAGDLLHMTRFGSSAPSFSVRRTVPQRCRSSTIVQDRIRDTSGTLAIGKVHKCLILLASPTGFEPVLPP